MTLKNFIHPDYNQFFGKTQAIIGFNSQSFRIFLSKVIVVTDRHTHKQQQLQMYFCTHKHHKIEEKNILGIFQPWTDSYTFPIKFCTEHNKWGKFDWIYV